eukprot:CAMPEP_0170092058 /NCGR_PEP_ID=MMETSP0019_2-20121128/25500_1 /TAXON_ID=98059 /ORGANISM="Dinobryon sp., Strain UTEXLB2267" /LENGTH=248 /DNA_ID=CAMNT_0010312257 /DNA_START=14 /DNA_END=757 /DNA_ORIENTATION=+
MTTIFKILGTVNDSDTYFCNYLANRIASSVEDVKIDFSAEFEVDYLLKIEAFKRGPLGSKFMHHKALHFVFRNDVPIGDINAFIELAGNVYNLEDPQISNTILFNRSVREDTYQLMATNKRPIVYMQFIDKAIGNRSPPLIFETIYIELYSDFCPKACDNFIKLCTAGTAKHYLNCPIHRMVKNGWFQCGDVVDGSGKYSCAATTKTIQDESFSIDFGLSVGGVVGYSNSGPHSSGSQFFVTLGPCEW